MFPWIDSVTSVYFLLIKTVSILQLEWIWQYQNGNRFPGVENWQSYSDIGDSSADIQTDSSITTTNSCYRRQVSVLTRHLTLDDSDREYRCYVINNGMSGSQDAEANAKVISVGTVSESGKCGL